VSIDVLSATPLESTSVEVDVKTAVSSTSSYPAIEKAVIAKAPLAPSSSSEVAFPHFSYDDCTS